MSRALGLVLLAMGCDGGKGSTTAEGTVGGQALTVAGAWWGGPFIVVMDQDLDCLEMAWVNRYYDDDDPPVDFDINAVQFNYEADEVVDGIYDVSGEAAVTASFVSMVEGVFATEKARSGQLIVDEITNNEVILGTFDLTFDSGTLKGELGVDWCSNVKG